MKKCNVNVGNTAPYAYITKGKQRVKQYVDTVYLQNGDEFEIELFNPTSNKVLAKITVNDKPIGSAGIVVRPGERVFLERFIDNNNKFLFETYNVSGGKEAMKAIENNGIVSIKFYDEQQPSFPFYGGTITINDPFYYDNSGEPFWSQQPTITCQSNFNDKVSYTANMNDIKTSFTPKSSSRKLSKSVETGRVEKGGNSKQSFIHDNTKFNAWYTWQSTWKILPISQKQIEPNEIKVYCSECGTRKKKQSHKFCPSCGTKY